MLVALAVCAALLLAVPSQARADGVVGGTVGFITADGNFFVQMGYERVQAFFAIPNGSSMYAYALVLNITSLSIYNRTAYVRVYSYAENHTVTNQTVFEMPGQSQLIAIPLPIDHSYSEIRIVVDGTAGYLYYESPYTFLSITSLPDGGIDLMIFIGIGLFLAMGFPLALWGERMTRRAGYCPKWNATLWLHGIFFGMVAWYLLDFPSINYFFRGFEVLLIPVPEAIFLFFWTAGRHSRSAKLSIRQKFPKGNHRMGTFNRDFLFYKNDAKEIIVLKQGRKLHDVIQWMYRAWGYGVPLYSRADLTGPKTPMYLDVEHYEVSGGAAIDYPMRMARGGKYDPADDFEVVTGSDDGDELVGQREYWVNSIVLDFEFKEPFLSFHRWKSAPETVDKNGVIHPEGKPEWKLSWPHVEKGHCKVNLASSHFVDNLAQEAQWVSVGAIVNEMDDLSIELATVKGDLQRLTSRRAEERLAAEREVRARGYRDLTPEEIEAYAVRHPKTGEGDRPKETEPTVTLDDSPKRTRKGASAA